MPKTMRYRSGSLIYFQGDLADMVYILKSGNVTLNYQDIESGKEVRDLVQRGEFFGVKSALGRLPRDENAQAVQDSVVLVFTVSEFEQFILDNPRIIIKMLKVFSNQLRKIHGKVSALLKTTKVESPDEGLFAIGEYYIRNKNFARAKYVFSRYLGCYQKSGNTVQAERFLRIAEAELARSGGSRRANSAAAKKVLDESVNAGSFNRFAKTFQPGEMIFAEYEPGETCYFIQAGRVELVKIMGSIEKTLDILKPSEIFGEMAILENSPRSATAVALDPVILLEFNKENFEILMAGNTKIAILLLKMFIKRIFDQKRRFMILALKDDEAKVADVFLMFEELHLGTERSADEREFRVSEEEISRWSSLSVQQVRNILSHFVNQRRIELFQDKIIIKNIGDFARFVNSKRNR